MKQVSEQQDSSVERLVRRSLISEGVLGRPFSELGPQWVLDQFPVSPED
jgi:hypothetical protein